MLPSHAHPRHAPRLKAAAALLGLGALLAPTVARAQLHADASAQVGLEKRLLSGRAAGVPDADPGVRAELRGHLALFPFVRVGAYGAFAFAPQGGAGRSLAALGLHARAISPLPRTERFSVWLSVGAGYARALSTPAGAGGFLEVPVGVGAGYKLRRPISLVGELQATFGAAHHGAAYAAGAGADAVALGLALGVLVDF
jgi:hypothetical protein